MTAEVVKKRKDGHEIERIAYWKEKSVGKVVHQTPNLHERTTADKRKLPRRTANDEIRYQTRSRNEIEPETEQTKVPVREAMLPDKY